MAEATQLRYDPIWWELRQREFVAAHLGGREWTRFVDECERRLGVPWSLIRTEFSRIPAVDHYG